MTVVTQGGSGQIVGQRDEQQDALGFGTVVLADGRRAPLAVLADGMGGHHGGAIAARLAIETFVGACRASPARTFTGALGSALLDANRALAVRSNEDARLSQMGCTLIATAVEGGVLHYVSVGDSLLWRIGLDRIERLNADHSMMPLVTAALAQGKMTQAEAQAHGSTLRSAVTGRPIDLVDLRSVELAREDWVLLSSDGILTLAEAEVHRLIRPSGSTAQARVDAVLDAVEQAGEPEQDNCTVVLLPMISVSAKPTRRPMATVGGTLAIVAGLGVVGAAGWELLRLDRPHASVPSRQAVVEPANPPDEAASVPPPIIPDERAEPVIARTRAAITDPPPNKGESGTKRGSRPATPTPSASVKTSPTVIPTQNLKPTLTPTPTPKATTTPLPAQKPTPTPTLIPTPTPTATLAPKVAKAPSGKSDTSPSTPNPLPKGKAALPSAKQDRSD